MDSMYTHLHKKPRKTVENKPKFQHALTYAYIINLVKENRIL